MYNYITLSLSFLANANSQATANFSTALICLVRTIGEQPETSCLAVHHLLDLNSSTPYSQHILEMANVTMEYEESYFSCDHYLSTKLALGGEGKVYLFRMINEDYVNIAPHFIFKLKHKDIVQAIKFNENGSRLYCGTNKGNIHVIENNKESQVINLNYGSIVDLDYLNENELIISAFNNNLIKIDLRCYSNQNGNQKHLLKFDEHINNCKKIRFTIDRCFKTLTSCGQDNLARIWSINSGQLIRLIDFDNTIEHVRNKKFTTDFLLDEQMNQVVKEESTATATSSTLNESNQTTNLGNQLRVLSTNQSNVKFYSKKSNEQYQIVSSSKWNCLNKQTKTLMIGSIGDSVDLFY